jgi:death-on-curing protein
MSWVWIAAPVVSAIHAAQLAEHGGAEGIREPGLLASALARPRDLAAYQGSPDLADLAAAYAFGIVRNHPFVDGNKRTAFTVSVTFCAINGRWLTASDADAIATFLLLAEGTLGEADLAAWFRANLGASPALE